MYLYKIYRLTDKHLYILTFKVHLFWKPHVNIKIPCHSSSFENSGMTSLPLRLPRFAPCCSQVKSSPALTGSQHLSHPPSPSPGGRTALMSFISSLKVVQDVGHRHQEYRGRRVTDTPVSTDFSVHS